jgi:exosortase E/protease (VPEID-CTERM system)
LLPGWREPGPWRHPRSALRWAIPAALLVVEYLILSFLVDLPTSGPAMRFVQAVRLAVPVILGSFAAGWMLRRGAPARAPVEPLPPWRPWPAAAIQPVAFALTAALAYAVLRPGRPPPSTSAVVLVLAVAAATGVIALWISAPPSWFAAVLFRGWAYPLLAVAVGVLAWRAAAGAEELWGVLSETTLRGAALLLRLLGADVSVGPEPDVIVVGDFGVEVTPICSGADGLGLVVLFTATWIALARERLLVRRSLLLIPLGMALAFAANVVRIAALVSVGGAGHVELATGGLHSKLGWILFIGIALGTIAVAERLPWFRRASEERHAEMGAVPPAAAAYVAPLLAALVTALVTSIWSDETLDRWYLLRILAASGVLWLVRRDLPRPAISVSWFPVVVAAIICAAWIALVPVDAAAGGQLVAELRGLGTAERWAWIAVRAVGSCLIVPVIEELAFRGFLMRWLVSPEFEHVPPRAWTWSALLLSSLAFGALHGHWILGTLSGLAFAAVLVRRGRLGDAILAHALTNAGLAVAVLAFGRWDLWA